MAFGEAERARGGVIFEPLAAGFEAATVATRVVGSVAKGASRLMDLVLSGGVMRQACVTIGPEGWREVRLWRTSRIGGLWTKPWPCDEHRVSLSATIR